MKMNIILLAAGNSKRFGSNKLLYEIDGKPIYKHVITSVLDAIFGEASNHISKIIMVSQYEEIRKNMTGLPITYVENKESELGISHSIKLGIEVDKTASNYMFIVCDQPYLTSSTIFSLITGYYGSGKDLGCLVNGDRRGNPCVFDRKYMEELLQLKGDNGGRKVRDKYIEKCFQLQVKNAKELDDIDFFESVHR